MTTFTIGAIVSKLKLDTRAWTRTVSRVQTSTAKMSKGFGAASVSSVAMGAALTVAAVALATVTLGLYAFTKAAKASITESIKFESALAGVRKTTEGTSAEILQIGEDIAAMSKRIPLGTTELLGLAEAGGQLGIAKEDLLDFTETMARLGVSTNMSAAEAATSLARWANVTGLATSELESLGSTIVELGNNFATTEREIIDMSMRLAGVGKQINMTDADIAAMSTGLSSLGLHAEMAGTAIGRVMSDMSSEIQSEGANLKIYAALAGQSSKEYAEAFKKDAFGAIMDMLDGLKQISDEGGNAFEILERLGFNQARIRTALLGAANATDLFREAQKRANEEMAEGNALQKESDQRFETTESQIEMAKNKFSDLARVLGDELKPAYAEVIGLAGDLADIHTRQVEDSTKDSPFKGMTLAVKTWASTMRMGLGALERRPDNPRGWKTMSDLKADIEREQAETAAYIKQQAETTVPWVEATEIATKGTADAAGDLARKVKEALGYEEAMAKAAEETAKALNRQEAAMMARHDVMPKEALASALGDVAALAEEFPDILDDAALTEIFSDIWIGFKAEGVRAFEDLTPDLAALPEAMREKFLGVRREIEFAAEAAKVVEQMKPSGDAEPADEGMTKMEKADAAVGSLLHSMKQVTGESKAMSLASMAASKIMSIAAYASLGPWGYVLLAIEAVTEAFGIMGDEGEKEVTGIGKVLDEIAAASDAWVDSITDKIVEFATTGKTAWGELVDQIIGDINRIAVSELLVSPAIKFLGGLVGFSDGGAFQNGNLVKSARGHVTSSPELFKFGSGQLGIRGEAGNEAVMPITRTRDGKLGVSTDGGGGGGVIVNVVNNGAAVDVQERRGADGGNIVDIVVNAVREGMARGELDNDMALNYGVLR